MSPSGSVSAVVVVIAHGSRAEAANRAHREAVAALDQRVEPTVVPAFLELAEPDIGGAIDAAAEAGSARIVVLPHFFYPGRHVAEDIPAIIDDAGARHPGVSITLLAASGADPAMADLLAAQIESALE